VEAVRHRAERRDADRLGQVRVQRPRQPRIGNRRRDARGGDLRERVHARIGAPRAVQRDRRAIDRRERLLDQALHRHALPLPLPPDEIRPVVRDDQLDGAHHVIADCRLQIADRRIADWR
jgi:hypothetical protein